jgi:hypothetical protein
MASFLFSTFGLLANVTLAIRSVMGRLSKDGKLSTAESCTSSPSLMAEKHMEAVFLLNAVCVTFEQVVHVDQGDNQDSTRQHKLRNYFSQIYDPNDSEKKDIELATSKLDSHEEL